MFFLLFNLFKDLKISSMEKRLIAILGICLKERYGKNLHNYNIEDMFNDVFKRLKMCERFMKIIYELTLSLWIAHYSVVDDFYRLHAWYSM